MVLLLVEGYASTSENNNLGLSEAKLVSERAGVGFSIWGAQWGA